MAMGGKATEGGPGPVVLDGQVLERTWPERDKDSPEVVAAWRHMVACARAFVRCADEFGDDIGATAEHYDALERAQERLFRAWEGEPVEPRAGISHLLQGG